MTDSIVIRKIGNDYGIFKMPKIELIAMAPSVEALSATVGSLLENSKPVESWPAVGQTYWFVNLPNPIEVSINCGVITEELMEKLEDQEPGKYGNMFQKHDQAVQMAKKLVDLFE